MAQISPKSRRREPVLDLATFDLNLLRVFDALLVTRGVSGAAARLDLSQPATSAALARIRTALRDPVLVRAGNRMRATALAEELHPRVTRILEEIGDALSSLAQFDPGVTTRRFRIVANDYVAAALLAPIAARLQSAAPHASLEVIPSDSAPELRLAERAADLIIADRWSVRSVHAQEHLFQEEFICIARTGHPGLSRTPTLPEFLAAGHALISSRGVTPGVVDAALEKSGHTRRVALTLPHYLVGPRIIAGTDLIMTLPRRVLDQCAPVKGLRVFAPPLKIPGFDVVMATDRRSEREPALRWLMQLVRSSL